MKQHKHTFPADWRHLGEGNLQQKGCFHADRIRQRQKKNPNEDRAAEQSCSIHLTTHAHTRISSRARYTSKHWIMINGVPFFVFLTRKH